MDTCKRIENTSGYILIIAWIHAIIVNNKGKETDREERWEDDLARPAAEQARNTKTPHKPVKWTPQPGAQPDGQEREQQQGQGRREERTEPHARTDQQAAPNQPAKKAETPLPLSLSPLSPILTSERSTQEQKKAKQGFPAKL